MRKPLAQMRFPHRIHRFYCRLSAEFLPYISAEFLASRKQWFIAMVYCSQTHVICSSVHPKFICATKNQGMIQIHITIIFFNQTWPHLMAVPSALNSKQTVISPLNGANPLTEVTALFWNHFEKFDSMAGVRIKKSSYCLFDLDFFCFDTGNVSRRDPDTGSWFIQILCQMIAKHSWNKDISTILEHVSDTIVFTLALEVTEIGSQKFEELRLFLFQEDR